MCESPTDVALYLSRMARTSRWDRPPVPKDVRWGVRLFGKVLICTGLLMFGFVAYQLWGTGIEYARAQNRLDGRFEELMEANGVDPGFNPFESPALSTTAAPTTSPPSTASSSPEEPSTTAAAETTTLAPTTTSAPTTAVPQILDWSYVEEEQFVGQLWIPSIGIEGSNAQNVVQGVGATDLQDGPGHYPDTPFPGELGNAAIAGHRTTYGAPFHDLPDMEIGDPIAFLLPDGRVYTYRMIDSLTVNPEDSWVVATTDPTRALLTLTTCTPVNTAQQRYVVIAEFVPEMSSPVGAFVPRNGSGVSVLPGQDEGDAAPAATTDPVLATEPATTVAATTEPAASATTAEFVDDPVVSTSPPATDATPETTASGAVPGDGDSTGSLGEATNDSEDAFSSHWFDDRAAFPQVALWGAIATAVVVAAYLLAKRLRNTWIGLAVGVVPFLVTLYFFYQNVNRLLPAAL